MRKDTARAQWHTVSATRPVVENATWLSLPVISAYDQPDPGRIPEGTPAMLAGIDEALRWPIDRFRAPTEKLVGLGL